MSAPDIVTLDCTLAPHLGPLGGDDSQPDLGERVLVTVALTPAKAHELALHKQERDLSGRITLAEQNRELGDPIMNLLVEHGYGEDP